MSSFQDDSDGNDMTKALEKDPYSGVDIFTEDAEEELKGILHGLMSEAQDENPEIAKEALLNSEVGKIANSYLHFWLTCLQADHNEQLDAQTTLGELLLFIAVRQAEMDTEALGTAN